MSLDLSAEPDLRGLARVVHALQVVAEPAGVESFLMGAAARDLMIRYAHGIDPSRGTEDVDFAVMVRDWKAYESLRAALIASGEFSRRPGPAAHRLRHARGLPLDIVPFGGIEGPDRTLVPEADETGALLLAHQSGHDLEGARRLLEVLCDELAGSM